MLIEPPVTVGSGGAQQSQPTGALETGGSETTGTDESLSPEDLYSCSGDHLRNFIDE